MFKRMPSGLRVGTFEVFELVDNCFVFVNGLHRSGTSILFKCLREHPEFSGFSDTGVMEDEGQHLQSVFEPARRYGGPGRFGFDPRSRMKDDSPLVTEENRVKLYYQWRRFWDTDKRYLLEKSPPNLLKTRFLQAMFPNSYFITIIRHPIGSGLATKKWSKTSVRSLIEHWLLCHEAFVEDMGHLRNVHTFRYEDFVEDPQGHLDAIYGFLGTDPHRNELEVRNVNQKYFRMWNELGSGRGTRRDVERAMNRFEGRVNRFGYSLKDPGRITGMDL
jgi:hypothetical protein